MNIGQFMVKVIIYFYQKSYGLVVLLGVSNRENLVLIPLPHLL